MHTRPIRPMSLTIAVSICITSSTGFQGFANSGSGRGLQVTHTYSAALDRNDHCLLQYGFVQDSPEPILAAVDHISGITMEYADDSLYGGVRQCLLQEPTHSLC